MALRVDFHMEVAAVEQPEPAQPLWPALARMAAEEVHTTAAMVLQVLRTLVLAEALVLTQLAALVVQVSALLSIGHKDKSWHTLQRSKKASLLMLLSLTMSMRQMVKHT
jgi:hypothetical protein